jgi:hypothetical protein
MNDQFCCNGDCNQGRTCPRRIKTDNPWVDRIVIAVCILTLLIAL